MQGEAACQARISAAGRRSGYRTDRRERPAAESDSTQARFAISLGREGGLDYPLIWLSPREMTMRILTCLLAATIMSLAFAGTALAADQAALDAIQAATGGKMKAAKGKVFDGDCGE